MQFIRTTRITMACPLSSSCLGMCGWTRCPGASTRALESTNNAEATPTSSTSNRSNHMTELARPSDHTPSSAGGGMNSTSFATFVNDEQLAAVQGSDASYYEQKHKAGTEQLGGMEGSKKPETPRRPGSRGPPGVQRPSYYQPPPAQVVLETRKFSSDYYPPKTLHQLPCGILRHMRAINTGCVNFLDKKDSRLKQLQGTLDSHSINCTPLELDET